MKLIKAINLLVFILILCGCGVHTSYAERYIPDSNINREKDNPLGLDILIHPTHTMENPPFLIEISKWFFFFFDTHEIQKAPYELMLVSRYYEVIEGKVDVTKVELHVHGQEEIVLATMEDKMTIQYQPWLKYAVSGNVSMDLGDQLIFEEGSLVTVTMDYIHPVTKEAGRVQKRFKAKIKEHSYDAVDILNSV